MIVKNKVPAIDKKLAEQITGFMQQLRTIKLEKTPGIAETLDWAAALSALHIDHLDKSINCKACNDRLSSSIVTPNPFCRRKRQNCTMFFESDVCLVIII